MLRVFGIKILTRANSVAENLSHQLQQRCSVSGTAKGKGKIKAAQKLKSKTGTQKGGKSVSGKYRKMGLIGDLEEMASMCVKSSTVTKLLSPKERAREAEREKLGLISKRRQKEIDLLKKQAKEETGKPSDSPGLNFASLGLVDVDAIPKFKLTVEDGRQLAKEYSRVLMRQHRARQTVESTLLRLKNEAINALPEHLKAAAMIPDVTPFPGKRYMATLTPPIEGYIDKTNRDATEDVVEKKKLKR